MAFAGLLVSIGILAVTWVVVTLAECGVTIGMILSLPFLPLIEWICNKMDKRTDEEKEEEIRRISKKYSFNYEKEREKILKRYGIK